MEFYFSDINLATTDHLIRIMFKDPEGYGKIFVSLIRVILSSFIFQHYHFLMNLLTSFLFLFFYAVVPMSVVASFKKIKALTSSHAQVAKILRTSTKLVSFSSSLSSDSPPEDLTYMKYFCYLQFTWFHDWGPDLFHYFLYNFIHLTYLFILISLLLGGEWRWKEG